MQFCGPEGLENMGGRQDQEELVRATTRVDTQRVLHTFTSRKHGSPVGHHMHRKRIQRTEDNESKRSTDVRDYQRRMQIRKSWKECRLSTAFNLPASLYVKLVCSAIVC